VPLNVIAKGLREADNFNWMITLYEQTLWLTDCVKAKGVLITLTEWEHITLTVITLSGLHCIPKHNLKKFKSLLNWVQMLHLSSEVILTA